MNKEIRSSVVVNLIRTITLTVLSFITFPFVCRVLQDEALGFYTWANTFVYYFLILAKLSIPNLAIRECSIIKNDKEKLNKKVQELFIIQLITTLLSFLLLLTLVFTIPSLANARNLILILSINFLAGAFSFEWVFIVFEKHFYMSIRSIIIICFTSILIFALIKYPEQVYLYAGLTVLVTVLTVISNLVYLKKFVSLKPTGNYNFKQYIRPLFLLFLLTAVLTLYNQTDTLILGVINTSYKNVGSYSVGIKGIEIIIAIITSLSAVFMPRAAQYYKEENKENFESLLKYSFNICFFIAVPAIATMATLAVPITSLISGSAQDAETFKNAYLILIILSSMVLTYSIGDIIYTQYLLPAKKEKIYFITILIGVILNISLSLLFALTIFKDDQAVGVAIATSITDLIIIIFLIIKTNKYSAKPILNINNLKIVIFGVIIAVFTYFISPLLINALSNSFNNNGTINLDAVYSIDIVLMILLDAVIYVGGLLICKENITYSLFHHNKVINNEK